MSAAAQAVYIAAGVGFCATETEFNTEQEAIREVDPRRSRVWKIKNPHSRNSVTGKPVVSADTEIAPDKGSSTVGINTTLLAFLGHVGDSVPACMWAARDSGGMSAACWWCRCASGLQAGSCAHAAPVCAPEQRARAPRRLRHQAAVGDALL